MLPKTNPFYSNYPVSNETARSLPKRKLENCACSDSYMNNDFFSVNLYEVTWVKYNPGKSHPISNYVNKYLPVYTKMHYENRQLFSAKLKNPC